jgi:hypothetical protein
MNFPLKNFPKNCFRREFEFCQESELEEFLYLMQMAKTVRGMHKSASLDKFVPSREPEKDDAFD